MCFSTDRNEEHSGEDWKARRKREALAFRANFEALIREIEQTIDFSAYGPHAEREVEVCFAQDRGSFHWFTMRVKWAVLLSLLDANIPTEIKDNIIFFPGPLSGGASPDGTRKLKTNIEGLDLLVLDFDKGDAPLNKLGARMQELGLEGAAYATFSHLKDESALAWCVTGPDPMTGNLETKPTAFQEFARARLGAGEETQFDATKITAEIAKAYMVEEQEFDAEILGDLTIVETDKREKQYSRSKNGARQAHETSSIVTRHNPIAKSRLLLLMSKRIAPREEESITAFQRRWEEEVYYPVARLIGFRFDPKCASTERGHYAMTRKKGMEPVPLCQVNGRLLDLEDPEAKRLLSPFQGSSGRRNSETAGAQRSKRSSQAHSQSGRTRNDWRGFKAADAAAAFLPSVTDKRTDESNPLVAFPCPFVHEHATSNDPAAHQCYAYNAGSPDKLPTVKCQSDTCHNRPYPEFLDALFDESVKADPAYRVAEKAERTGLYIPERQLSEKLHEINETWAVVRIGHRVRYLHENEEGEIELYDAKSLTNWFSNWFYYWVDKRGNEHPALIISAWLQWQYRRQYRGVAFCPQPEGAPKGIYNTYYGFAVEAKRGSWKRLLGHIYRNVCRRDPAYFRFFVAWLAQLVQQPHIKPGTNIVLQGKEGVGKSKVGEWIVVLFGRNAIVVSEAERITGRFNAHLENKLFLMAEEAFWAGDKSAEGKLKDLAAGMNMSYERKGLDPYEGKNYTRIMIASNEDWVVPASSGGRRWFVLKVGDEHEKDYAYFAAIDEEMEAGGLAAMLHDLQRTKLPQEINVRSAPVTPWLVEQRLHSYDNKLRWWRGVLLEGGFRDNESGTFIALDENKCTAVKREDLFCSARPYFLGPKGVDPTPSEVGQFVRRMLGKLPESRPTIEGKRHWCTIFPPLKDMRQRWLKETGERIDDAMPAAAATDADRFGTRSASPTVDAQKVATGAGLSSADSLTESHVTAAIAAAVKEGLTDPQELVQIAESAAGRAKEHWQRLGASIPKTRH